MRADERMRHRRALAPLLGRRGRGAGVDPARDPVVHGLQPVEPRLHRRRQRRPGEMRVRELRLAALGRHFQRVQDRHEGRDGVIGLVRVPEPVELRHVHVDDVARGIEVGQRVDEGEGRAVGQFADMAFELAELGAEGGLLVLRERLVAEDEDGVVADGVADGGDGGRGERVGEVEAGDLGRTGLGERCEGERGGGVMRILIVTHRSPP